jgi:hypothetical protein
MAQEVAARLGSGEILLRPLSRKRCGGRWLTERSICAHSQDEDIALSQIGFARPHMEIASCVPIYGVRLKR